MNLTTFSKETERNSFQNLASANSAYRPHTNLFRRDCELLLQLSDSNSDSQLSLEELDKAINEIKEVKGKWKLLQGFLDKPKTSLGPFELKAISLLECISSWMESRKRYSVNDIVFYKF